MSACSSTFRALSQSRVSTNKTLLPFLYQTATIQQWKPAAQPIARRYISRYDRRDEAPAEEIPFENKDDLPPALDELEPARKTTITSTERAAFEKLYRKYDTRGRPQNEKDHEVEIDAIADEYYEDDEDNPANIDKIFDEALKGKSSARREWNRSSSDQLRSRKPRQDLESMAQHILKGTRPAEMERPVKRTERRKDMSAKAAKLNEERLRERNRVDELLKSATTDRDLWQTLHREVFDRIRNLNLDGPPAPKSSKRERENKSKSESKSKSEGKSKSTTATTVDPKILFKNYPHHLLTALSTLRTNFPSSPLPLSILPAIKSLGRSSYALGATTALYTQLLRTAWLQQSSYPLLINLLTDMHNGAVEFSLDTLHLLDAVVKEYDMARSGRLGREMQMVYGMEQFGEGIREVRRWREIVAQKVGADTRAMTPTQRRRVSRRDQLVPLVGPLVEGLNGGIEDLQQQQQQDVVRGNEQASYADMSLSDVANLLLAKEKQNTNDAVHDTEVQEQPPVADTTTTQSLPLNQLAKLVLARENGNEAQQQVNEEKDTETAESEVNSVDGGSAPSKTSSQ
jgi:hypothetical protein